MTGSSPASLDPAQELSRRIDTVLRIDPFAPALEFERRWHTWGELGAAVDAVAALVTAPGTQVGIILRNRPPHVAALLGVVLAGGCVVTINPHRGVDRTRDDIAGLDLDLVMGTTADVAAFVAGDAATRVAVDDLESAPVVTAGRTTGGSAPLLPGVAVRMLTSGTTGTPKRVELSYDTLERVLGDAKHYERDKGRELRLRAGIVVVNSPLVHLGGVFRILTSVNDGRSFCLLERFAVDQWADAVRRHRPKTASLVPTALRMVLESDVDAADLASLRSVISGTAPLSPDDADAFMERFGVPVLVSYAATEFGGAVAGWNLTDHAEFWATKRGSVGRAHPGCDLRVVDEADGSVLPPGEEGLLEVRAGQLGSDEWVRTTDLTVIDADGFVWIRGRSDQAIIRGGFKVLPDVVRAALERQAEVRGAAVVGRPDARLGAVPVAAVELRSGADSTVDDILGAVGGELAPYEVPVEVRIVEELPRTEAGKPDLVAVRELLGVAAP